MKLVLLTFLLFYAESTYGQNQVTDSLLQQLAVAKQDTSRALIWASLAYNYRTMKPDSALWYGQQALTLAQRINFIRGQARALVAIGFTYREVGDLPKAMQLYLNALQLAKSHNLIEEMASAILRIGSAYNDLGDYPRARYYYGLALTA